MRPLKSFLHRRKITDPEQWLHRMGLRNQEQLATWCENNDVIIPDVGEYFSVPEDTTVNDDAPTKPAPAKNVKSTVQKAEGIEETWHTPAAERPRKQTSNRAVQSKKKRTSTKKKS